LFAQTSVVVSELIEGDAPQQLDLSAVVHPAPVFPAASTNNTPTNSVPPANRALVPGPRPSAPVPGQVPVLDFGGLRLASGRAFELVPTNATPGDETFQSSAHSAAVSTRYMEQSGRRFIVESVPVKNIRSQLLNLPLLSRNEAAPSETEFATARRPSGATQVARAGQPPSTKALPMSLPHPSEAQPSSRTRAAAAFATFYAPKAPANPGLARTGTAGPALMAQNDAAAWTPKSQRPVQVDSRPALLLDWNMVPLAYTNYTFNGTGGTNFVVETDCYLSGTTRFTNSPIVKYYNGASLHVQGPMVFDGTVAAFTSINDNSIGQNLGTGSPAMGAYGTALEVDGATSGLCNFQHAHFYYATVAIQVSGGGSYASPHVGSNCSFTNCYTPFALIDTFFFPNSFSINTSNGAPACLPFDGTSYVFSGTNVTFNCYSWQYFAADYDLPAPTVQSAVRLHSSTITNSGGGGAFTNTSGPVVVVLNPPTITATATAPLANKSPATNGAFLFTRTDGGGPTPLPIQFAFGGTALSNTDYAAIGTSTNLPASPATNVTVSISPLTNETSYERSLLLAPAWTPFSPYDVGVPEKGVVYIFDTRVSAPPRVPPLTTVPAAGSPGATVAISGTNFNTVPWSNTVFFGEVQASVLSASSNSLTVRVPVSAAYFPITVTANGLTASPCTNFLVTFPGPCSPCNSSNFTSASLSSQVDLGVGTGPYRTAIGDLDGDGKPDLVIAHAYDAALWIFLNTSTSGSLTTNSFAQPIILSAGGGSWNGYWGLALGDLNGDGKLDIVVANWLNNSVSVLQNLSTPGSLSFGPEISLPVSGQTMDIAIQIFWPGYARGPTYRRRFLRRHHHDSQ